MNTTADVEKAAELKGIRDRLEKIDFKMVTFSLAGKDYGIDIMRVKEISKAGKFTYVPNTPPFVRGVYNLRGEIISIIDLRIMFHLPAEKKSEEALENILILRLEDLIIGIVVDSIDKVVGISKERIQPPHPLFGDINVKYISGVVENSSKLFIILDVERIFSQRKAEEPHSAPAFQTIQEQEAEQVKEVQKSNDAELNFIIETLSAFKNYMVSPLNNEWIAREFSIWKKEKGSKGTDFQLKDTDDANDFLTNFYSPHSGKFWEPGYIKAVSDSLPEGDFKSITVWNPGCGNGQETYSFTCILKKKYPQARIKIWANDSDLLSISTAPNLLFAKEEIPEMFHEYITEGKNGYHFKAEVKDLILFEYHDIQNNNTYEGLDFILARDVLSFLQPSNQVSMAGEFQDKLKSGGMLIAGANEDVSSFGGWSVQEKEGFRYFIKQ